MKVVLSDAAFRDLWQIRSWLSQAGAGQAAQRKQDAIHEALIDLGSEANLWPLLKGYPNQLTRKRSVAGHVILYRVLRAADDASVEYIEVDAVLAPGRFKG